MNHRNVDIVLLFFTKDMVILRLSMSVALSFLPVDSVCGVKSLTTI